MSSLAGAVTRAVIVGSSGALDRGGAHSGALRVSLCWQPEPCPVLSGSQSARFEGHQKCEPSAKIAEGLDGGTLHVDRACRAK